MLSAVHAAIVLQLQQRRSRLDSRFRGMSNRKKEKKNIQLS
jgi:hypothetical protein